MLVETNQTDVWTYNYHTSLEVLPPEGVHQALSLIDQWRFIFPLGNTWVGTNYDVPSLFIRVDCVYSADRGLQVFEIEERPSGVGLSRRLNPWFAERFDALRKEWPAFRWVADPTRLSDDAEWLGPGLSLAAALKSKDLVLVRARPERAEYHPLEERSVSSVQHEGDKNYGIALGLWQRLHYLEDDTPDDVGGDIDPPIVGPAVVKPLKGARNRDVMCYLGSQAVVKKIPGRGKVTYLDGVELFKSRHDTIGYDGLRRKVASGGPYVCQDFIRPLRRPQLPGQNVIYRFFFGFSPRRDSYVPLGGVWAASRSLRVGEGDGTVFGPLAFEE